MPHTDKQPQNENYINHTDIDIIVLSVSEDAEGSLSLSSEVYIKENKEKAYSNTNTSFEDLAQCINVERVWIHDARPFTQDRLAQHQKDTQKICKTLSKLPRLQELQFGDIIMQELWNNAFETAAANDRFKSVLLMEHGNYGGKTPYNDYRFKCFSDHYTNVNHEAMRSGAEILMLDQRPEGEDVEAELYADIKGREYIVAKYIAENFDLRLEEALTLVNEAVDSYEKKQHNTKRQKVASSPVSIHDTTAMLLSAQEEIQRLKKELNTANEQNLELFQAALAQTQATAHAMNAYSLTKPVTWGERILQQQAATPTEVQKEADDKKSENPKNRKAPEPKPMSQEAMMMYM